MPQSEREVGPHSDRCLCCPSGHGGDAVLWDVCRVDAGERPGKCPLVLLTQHPPRRVVCPAMWCPLRKSAPASEPGAIDSP